MVPFGGPFDGPFVKTIPVKRLVDHTHEATRLEIHTYKTRRLEIHTYKTRRQNWITIGPYQE